MIVVVINCQVIAEVVADCDVMPAVKAELPAFQSDNDFSEDVCFLVKLFLLFGHKDLLSGIKKAPRFHSRRASIRSVLEFLFEVFFYQVIIKILDIAFCVVCFKFSPAGDGTLYGNYAIQP